MMNDIIIVMFYVDEKGNKLISHGINTRTLRNVGLEEMSFVQARNSGLISFHKGLEEWILVD